MNWYPRLTLAFIHGLAGVHIDTLVAELILHSSRLEIFVTITTLTSGSGSMCSPRGTRIHTNVREAAGIGLRANVLPTTLVANLILQLDITGERVAL